MCAAMLRTLSAYGRERRMRSCALRILDAATISIALVILRVFWTLLIFVRISLLPAISVPRKVAAVQQARSAVRSERAGFLEVLDDFVQLGLDFLRELRRVFDGLDQRRELRAHVLAQRTLGVERLGDVDVVEVTVVHREQRERHLPDLQRLVL